MWEVVVECDSACDSESMCVYDEVACWGNRGTDLDNYNNIYKRGRV